jgi:hypothetical protein
MEYDLNTITNIIGFCILFVWLLGASCFYVWVQEDPTEGKE